MYAANDICLEMLVIDFPTKLNRYKEEFANVSLCDCFRHQVLPPEGDPF